MIRVQCPKPNCHNHTEVNEVFIGRSVRCSKCGTQFVIKRPDPRPRPRPVVSPAVEAPVPPVPPVAAEVPPPAVEAEPVEIEVPEVEVVDETDGEENAEMAENRYFPGYEEEVGMANTVRETVIDSPTDEEAVGDDAGMEAEEETTPKRRRASRTK